MLLLASQLESLYVTRIEKERYRRRFDARARYRW